MSSRLLASAFALIWLLVLPIASRAAAELPIANLDSLFGAKGALTPAGVVKYGWPRTDLNVKMGAIKIAPGLALGSWAAFAPAGDNRAIAMGDLVLLHSEVNPVVRALQAGGLNVTAVHNHLAGSMPRILYVHFMGDGDALKLAQGLLAALKQSATPLTTAPPTHLLKATENEPPWVGELEKSLRRSGVYKDGVLGVSVARADEVTMGSFRIPHSMGIATALNFQSAGDGKVASTGDFVMVAGEVNPVLAALEQHHVELTALHSHMLDDSPHLFFMHYWAVGTPGEVGAALAAALAQMHVKPAKPAK